MNSAKVPLESVCIRPNRIGGIVAAIEPTVGMKFKRKARKPQNRAKSIPNTQLINPKHKPVQKLVRNGGLCFGNCVWFSALFKRIFLLFEQENPKRTLVKRQVEY